MKSLILALLALVSISSQADGLRDFLSGPAFDAVCKQSVQDAGGSTTLRRPNFTESETSVFVGMDADPTSAGNFALYRADKSNPTQLSEIFRLSGGVRDILYLKNAVWFLESDKLIALNLDNGTTRELSLADHAPIHNYDHAFDMVSAGDNSIVIADGVAGLKVINAEQMTIARTIDLGLGQQAGGHKSLAASLTKIDENTVLVGVDNLTMPAGEAFNGVIEVNVASGSFAQYPYQSGILSQVSKLTYADGTLWINNWGTLQFASMKSIRQNHAVTTGYIPFRLTDSGKTYSTEPVGEFFVLGGDLFACAERHEIMTTKPSPHVGITLRQSMPAHGVLAFAP